MTPMRTSSEDKPRLCSSRNTARQASTLSRAPGSIARMLRRCLSSTPSTTSEGSFSVLPRRCTRKFVPSMYNAQYLPEIGRVSHDRAASEIEDTDVETRSLDTSMPRMRREIMPSIRFESPARCKNAMSSRSAGSIRSWLGRITLSKAPSRSRGSRSCTLPTPLSAYSRTR